ncbi:MAG: hypothetical protein QOI12_3334 [Alphaproteobacteria bacterium]|jgi:hypothetical protein|nr:hypothetical protein [Alphaproteobacteria bacterium]
MRNNRTHHPVQWALAAICLGTLAGPATAGSFTRGCAARDMQILMLIEERVSAEAISSQRLDDAMLTMMHARTVCHEGYVVDALALYDKVAETIAPNPTVFGQRQ